VFVGLDVRAWLPLLKLSSTVEDATPENFAADGVVCDASDTDVMDVDDAGDATVGTVRVPESALANLAFAGEEMLANELRSVPSRKAYVWDLFIREHYVNAEKTTQNRN